MVLPLSEVTLFVILGTLGVIVYALRVLVVMEKRVASLERNIHRLVKKILKEELVIERQIKSIKRKKR